MTQNAGEQACDNKCNKRKYEENRNKRPREQMN